MSAKSLLAICASQTGVQVSLPTTTRSPQANGLGWVLRPWRNFSDASFDCCGRGAFRVSGAGIRRSEVWYGIGRMEAEKADRYDRETWERFCARECASRLRPHTALSTSVHSVIGDDDIPRG